MMSKEMLKRIEEQDAKLARMLQEKEKQCIPPVSHCYIRFFAFFLYYKQ